MASNWPYHLVLWEIMSTATTATDWTTAERERKTERARERAMMLMGYAAMKPENVRMAYVESPIHQALQKHVT